MQRAIVYISAIIGGAAFLSMVKLMNDMTMHMGRMTEQVALMSSDLGQLRAEMGSMVEQVSGIQDSVRYMLPLAADVQGIRQNVAAMAGIIHKGGEQIERMNPMQMMEEMVIPGQQGRERPPRPRPPDR